MGQMIGRVSEKLEWCLRDTQHKASTSLVYETLGWVVQETCLGCEHRKAVMTGWYCDYEEVLDESGDNSEE